MCDEGMTNSEEKIHNYHEVFFLWTKKWIILLNLYYNNSLYWTRKKKRRAWMVISRMNDVDLTHFFICSFERVKRNELCPCNWFNWFNNPLDFSFILFFIIDTLYNIILSTWLDCLYNNSNQSWNMAFMWYWSLIILF